MKKRMIVFLLGLICVLSSKGHAKDVGWEKYKEDVLARQGSIKGWCSREKAETLMDIIYEINPDCCVEIGVFCGASAHPVLSTLRYLNHGKLVAIDSWDVSNAIYGWEEDNENYEWWSEVDFNAAKQNFRKMLKAYKLGGYCETRAESALQAVKSFKDESIDFLHVDGNHSEAASLRDVTLYLPKVRKGGIIVLTDADSSEAFESVCYLLDYCEIHERSDFGYPFLIFVKN